MINSCFLQPIYSWNKMTSVLKKKQETLIYCKPTNQPTNQPTYAIYFQNEILRYE